MEQWISFIHDRWFVIIVALIVLVVVVNVIKTVAKWILVLAILAGVIVYGMNYEGEWKDIGATLVNDAKEQAIEALAGEAKEAEYKQNEDGTYTVTTKNLRLDGKIGSNEAKLTFKGQTITIKLDETLNAFIEKIKNNSSN